MSDQSQISIESTALARLRIKALRRGLWFRILTRSERALIELSIRVVDRVRGLFLAKMLLSIMQKLLNAMEGIVARSMRTVGRSMAERLSCIAQSWGNESAVGWVEDRGFLQYLVVTHINTPTLFKS